MRFKVGDRVQIKSIDWYNENKNKFGKVWTVGLSGEGTICFDQDNAKYCGKVLTIAAIEPDNYAMAGNSEAWTDEMIEGLAEEETKPNIIEEAKTYCDSIKDAWICPEGYIFKDENGNVINTKKIVLEKKEKRYPTTYKECCDVLGLDTMDNDAQGYKAHLIIQFQELLIARDAYWKIAGEEFNWDNTLYFIYTDEYGNVIESDDLDGHNCVLAFPDKASRDTFYENFKKLIEQCKELL